MDSAALAIRLLSPNLSTSLPYFRSTTNHKPTTPSVVRIRCLQTPSPGPASPPGPVHGSTFSCSAVAQEAPPKVSSAPDAPRVRLARLVDEFRSLPEPVDRVKRLLRYGGDIPPFPEAERTPSNRVMGCTAQVWLAASADTLGRMRFVADSDSEITKGFCSCLIWVLDGAKPEEVLEVCPDDFTDLNVVGLPGRTSSRVNTWHNVLISLQKRTRTLLAEMDGKPPVERFPSLVIGPDGIQAKGSYAEAQVGVYRMSSEQIGCSLADSAASPAYMHYLQATSRSPPSLHVIYVNTSFETKAHGHELVPTITCTSLKIVQTILQAFAQIPELNIWYGPHSYMGANISELFSQMSSMADEEIAEMHPKHDRNSIKSLLL